MVEWNSHDEFSSGFVINESCSLHIFFALILIVRLIHLFPLSGGL